MNRTPHNQQTREAVLADVAVMGVRPAARKHGIPRRTVYTWAKEAKTDIIRAHITPKPSVGRILIYDIECLPNRGYFFDTRNENRSIPLSFIEKGKSVCSIAYKWLGEPETYAISISDFPHSDTYDDKWVVQAFLPIVEQAHYTVAHFGAGFDEPFLAARCMYNRLPPFPPVCNIDTYKLAKARFKGSLNSNSLDHLATLLTDDRKHKTDAMLWVKCAQGNRDAINQMVLYNKQDVEVLEEVFVRMLPYVKSKINLNLLIDDAVFRCKSCGGSNMEHKGFELLATTIRHRYRCCDCSAWSTVKPRKL